MSVNLLILEDTNNNSSNRAMNDEIFLRLKILQSDNNNM